MFIVQTGAVFTASQIKDDGGHFLSITFGEGPPNALVFADFSANEDTTDHQTIIQIALLMFGSMLPVAEANL